MQSELRAINEMVMAESGFIDRITEEVARVIVGQKDLVKRVLIGLLTGGHVLLEGVPGLAKTLTIKTVSDTLQAHFSRIQFTPDLLPADIIGTTIYNQHTGEFTAKKGPVFANLVLADEINRAPAKVQSALLEAMQEHQVTIGDTTYKVPEPFMVMATQNPIEQEGTYPLPEAQLDRFMLMIKVVYPSREEERQIMDRMTASSIPAASAVIAPEELLKARAVVNQVYLDDKLRDYVVDVVTATRSPKDFGLKGIGDFIEWGASPRASIYLAQAGRAHAFLEHRGFVIPDDIKSIGPDVLRHRIILTYEAEAEEISAEDVIRKLFEHVEVP
jgi:MoxR-like ATPase